MLARTLPDWVDTWAALRNGEEGKTFDGRTNSACRDAEERMRYDRLMLKSAARPSPGGSWWQRLTQRRAGAAWVAAGIEMVGTEPINDMGLKPSDHYGLVLDVTWVADTGS